MDVKTLTDLLDQRSLQQPRHTAYIFLADGENEEYHITYAELAARAKQIAIQIQNVSAGGERVMLLYPPGLEYICAFFGCLYAGVIAVPAYPPRLNRPDPRLQSIVRDCQATVALTTAAILSNIRNRFVHSPELAQLQWLSTDQTRPTGEPDLAEAMKWNPGPVHPETPAFLQYTSGSTSNPRGVKVTHNNLLHNLELIHQAFQFTPQSKMVIWLPPYHDMGLIGGILEPLYGGFPVVLMPPLSFLQSPIRWLQAISRTKVPVSGGPNFAYDLCVQKITPKQCETLDLSGWEIAFSGAEPVLPDTLDQFTAKFQSCGFRREAFYPCYGLAEATLFVSGGLKNTPPVVKWVDSEALKRNKAILASAETPESGARRLTGCGKSPSSQKVIIVDIETNQECSEGKVGEIWVSGPSVASGYWNRPEESRDIFEGYLTGTKEGPFLRTGDLGFALNGELFVTGRLKDLIIIRGRNYYPQDIELAAERSHEALPPNGGAAFAVEINGQEQLVIVHELKASLRKTNPDEIFDAINQAVVQDIGIHPYAVVLVKPLCIPKTSSGKIQRRLCQKLYLANELQAIASWTMEPGEAMEGNTGWDFCDDPPPGRPQVEEKQPNVELFLQKLAAKVLKTSPAKVDTSQPLIALGMDSMMVIELQSLIDTHFQVEIPAAELLDDINISGIAARIEAARQEKEVPLSSRRSGSLPCPEPVNSDDCIPLSYEQERLWMLDQALPGNPAYHIPMGIHFQGSLDLVKLQHSFGEVIARHSSFRTVIGETGGRPHQVIVPPSEFRVPIIDLSFFPASDRVAEVQRIAAEEIRRPFDLRKGPLYRVTILRLDALEYVLLIVAHHIITDIRSLGLFMKELGTFYTALVAGEKPVLPEVRLQYSDFAHWQRKHLTPDYYESHLNFWRKYLAGAPALLPLPSDRPRPETRNPEGSYYFSMIPDHVTEIVRNISREKKVTVFTILLAAFQVMLYRYTEQPDILVGTPVVGRYHPELKDVLGFFAHPLVIRTQFNDNVSFAEILSRVHRSIRETYEHGEVPFMEVAGATYKGRYTNFNPLFQVMFSLVGSPLKDVQFPGATLQRVDIEAVTSDFDLFITATEEENRIHLAWGYSTALFDKATVEHLAGFFLQTLEQCAGQPDRNVNQSQLPEVLREKMAAYQKSVQKESLVIASTFTAEPLQEPLTFWMQQLEIEANITFAPYNQIFQQLLDPTSLLAKNTRGVNIILLRFEDWIRYQREPAVAYDEIIHRNVRELIGALKTLAQRTTVPYFICISPSNLKEPELLTVIKEAEELLYREINGLNGIYLVTAAELNRLYPVEECFDPYSDEIAHLPYTEPFFAALGTLLARRIFAVYHPPYKVIVLDCDQTLWQGVCGEDGPEGVRITPGFAEWQRLLIQQHDAGMLLCLCSKNNEADVWKVFDSHPEMPLKREHIVAARINWQPKSVNLRELAAELDLGLDSFIFIDDNPLECAEVQASCPEVLTLQLPGESANIPKFAAHIWAFDHLRVTAEDRGRTLSYQQNIARRQYQRDTSSFEEFMAGLELEVQNVPLSADNIARVAQLTQRTNQFNFSGIRRTEAEIESILTEKNMDCMAFQVRDRFGDYGLVGVVILKQRDHEIFVDTFLLSCRALGRGVEHRIFKEVAEIAVRRGCDNICIPFVPSEKNQPARDFLDSVAEGFRKTTGQGYLYVLPAGLAREIKPSIPSHPDPAPDQTATPSAAQPANEMRTLPGNRKTKILAHIARQLNDTERILGTINAGRKLQPGGGKAFIAPGTPIEMKLAEIWSELLQVERIGIYDDFLECGGHSILATQVLSRVRQVFQVEIPLQIYFTGSFTIAKLAREIVHQQLKPYDGPALEEKLAIVNSLSDDEIRQLLVY